MESLIPAISVTIGDPKEALARDQDLAFDKKIAKVIIKLLKLMFSRLLYITHIRNGAMYFDIHFIGPFFLTVS